MEDRYLETHITWNKIAQLYEEKFMDLEIYTESYKRFCVLLSKAQASVLELGCGPGNITRHLLRLNPQFKILATDVSKNMLELAKKNNPAIDTQILDCRNLNTLKNTFDGIVCGFTLPYLSKEDVSTLIADCTKIMIEKGVLYLSFVEGNYEDSCFISGSSGDRTYFYYHELNQIKEAVESNNLTLADHSHVTYKKTDGTIEIHTLIMAKKIK
jgi:ubiquinone/menaquinone biosynthesis C-methylase UbiE